MNQSVFSLLSIFLPVLHHLMSFDFPQSHSFSSLTSSSSICISLTSLPPFLCLSSTPLILASVLHSRLRSPRSSFICIPLSPFYSACCICSVQPRLFPPPSSDQICNLQTWLWFDQPSLLLLLRLSHSNILCSIQSIFMLPSPCPSASLTSLVPSTATVLYFSISLCSASLSMRFSISSSSLCSLQYQKSQAAIEKEQKTRD